MKRVLRKIIKEYKLNFIIEYQNFLEIKLQIYITNVFFLFYLFIYLVNTYAGSLIKGFDFKLESKRLPSSYLCDLFLVFFCFSFFSVMHKVRNVLKTNSRIYCLTLYTVGRRGQLFFINSYYPAPLGGTYVRKILFGTWCLSIFFLFRGSYGAVDDRVSACLPTSVTGKITSQSQ